MPADLTDLQNAMQTAGIFSSGVVEISTAIGALVDSSTGGSDPSEIDGGDAFSSSSDIIDGGSA